ncbi:acetate--CoA ligase family protein [Dethiosulfatarculus sandiegensis]|uniref:acetate--CoA ligase family protein n=1 Tax=Dethiosulfatarculus sandiegensis TaxID=1429043 RepID=UPI0005C8FFA0|nr:acetate--CoA ligase family protein [Dethiosulfatarculus sandiegensis]
MQNILKGFLEPASIAVVGASENTMKPGGKIVENLISKGYEGALFLLNPKAQTVQGKKAFASLAELPRTPDLVYIAIPAPLVGDTLAELGSMGVKRVIILSAGFGEINEKGRQEEKRLAEIADQYGMVILGPNCLGVMSPVHAGKFAGLLPEMKPDGLDFISGSGATVDILSEQAVSRGLFFNSFFTVGNSAQTGVDDVLALLDQDHTPQSPKHILLYMEKISSAEKLLNHARSLAQKGCVIAAIKSGVTEDGERAAASHTGAMAVTDTAVQALFDKAGIIRASSKLEMVDLASALVMAKGKFNGKRACVVTDAGGPGVMTTDELNRQGIKTPLFKPETQAKLAELLPPGAGVKNPVDLLPTRTPSQIAETMKIIAEMEAGNLDYILIQVGDPGFRDNWPVYEAILKSMETLDLPVFASFSTSISSGEALKKYRAKGKCHFEDEVSMARAVGRMANRPKIHPPKPDPVDYDKAKVAQILNGATGVVSPDKLRQVLMAAGIPTPKELIITTEQELKQAESTVPLPWVMKVVGPLHKTDLGGVVTNVSREAAGKTIERLMKIENAQGVMVQEQVQGIEVIMGLSRESGFGHLVAFGLGGVLAEALKDVRFGLSPLVPDEALTMINSIKALPVLKGYRGQPGMDLNRLADILTRVSLLARDVPQIKEMDINPLKGQAENLSAVDVRIIMD